MEDKEAGQSPTQEIRFTESLKPNETITGQDVLESEAVSINGIGEATVALIRYHNPEEELQRRLAWRIDDSSQVISVGDEKDLHALGYYELNLVVSDEKQENAGTLLGTLQLDGDNKRLTSSSGNDDLGLGSTQFALYNWKSTFDTGLGTRGDMEIFIKDPSLLPRVKFGLMHVPPQGGDVK